MKISISIVTYNSLDDIGDVLNCIGKSDCISDIELYISDNCSSDGTVGYIKNNFPFAHIIENSKNGGYGYGHNVVIEKVKSDIHFIINPDIRFDEHTLSTTASFLMNNDDVVLCTPEMVTENGEFVFPPKAQPRLHFIVGRFLRNVSFFSKWRKEYVMYERVTNNNGAPFDIEFCSGAFMAIKTDYLKQVDGFDDRYFLYYEDADLTRKLLKCGRCVCIPKLSIIHEGKREAYRSSTIRKIMLSSMFKYFRKWGFKL